MAVAFQPGDVLSYVSPETALVLFLGSAYQRLIHVLPQSGLHHVLELNLVLAVLEDLVEVVLGTAVSLMHLSTVVAPRLP